MEQRRILVVTQHYWPEQFRINDIVAGFVADGIGVPPEGLPEENALSLYL